MIGFSGKSFVTPSCSADRWVTWNSPFVLRQPTRKQAVLSSVWGRLAYFAQFNARLSGPAVFLEAQELGRPWRKSASMSVDARRELERLRTDGHPVEEVGGGYRWQLTLDAARSTQLYRTLLHEIGHQVDYLASVKRPQAALNPDDPASEDLWDKLSERYWAKPTAEKETFAHRYAAEVSDLLRRQGKLPFHRLADPHRLREQGLNPGWFSVPDTQARPDNLEPDGTQTQAHLCDGSTDTGSSDS